MEHNVISPLFSPSFANHAKNCMIHNCIVETSNAKHFPTYKWRCANTDKQFVTAIFLLDQYVEFFALFSHYVGFFCV